MHSVQRRRSNRSQLVRAVIQSLENRRYLSQTFTGTSGDDTATIATSGQNVVVTINGQAQSFVPVAGEPIIVNLGDGNDTISIAAGVPAVSVGGGAGNDSIVALNTGDTLVGRLGNDTIIGSGNSSISGGDGDDLILTGGASGDTIDGGAGLNFAQRNVNDTMRNIFEVIDPIAPAQAAAASAETQAAPAAQTSVTGTVVNGVLQISGTAGDDTISVAPTLSGLNLRITTNRGPMPPVPMAGLLGILVSARAGNDSISVSSSVTLPATLKGGLGDDTLTGGGGDNVLIGGIGNDSLVGGGSGGSGENLLVPGQLTAFTSAPTGNDTLDGGGGYSIADFSHRTDALTLSNDGNQGSGDLAAGEKSEIMANVSAIWGGTANDTITGAVPDEFLSGAAGADSILGGGANDLLIGGKGADTVLPAAEPVTLFLRDNAADLYDNVNTPSEDTLVLDPALDMPLLTSPITAGPATATLSKVATVDINTYGTSQDLASAPGDTTQQFVTTRNGYILILDNGILNPTPLLNMSAAGVNIYTGGEGGLLDLAFSPQFDKPGTFGFGKFYTFQTEPFSMITPADYASPEDYPTTSTLPNNQITIREWTINPNNPDLALTTSRVLLRINHPESNHQGGSLRFGPDGDLYIGLGDGGGANDQNGNGPDDPTDGHTNDIGNGQDLTVPFGKILRINPNPHAKNTIVSTNGQYSIPDSNPFIAGTDGDLKEIYAYGLRNPFRMAFDSLTGKLYVNNVGQSAIEQLDLITPGANFGWPFREGTRDNSGDFGHAPPPGFTFSVPIAEYTHGDGDATIGGDLYRGANHPQLDGDYLFGDLNGITGSGDGRLFYVSGAGGTIHQLTLSAGSAQLTGALYAVTQDSAGNVYYLLSDGSILTIASA